jgi:hypothetical protein
MNITDFTQNHIEEATVLAKANYDEEKQFVKILPTVDTLPELKSFADNCLGAAAFENNRMPGFLCCYPPHENAFRTSDVKGVFSPIHAHGAVCVNYEGYTRLGADFESFNPAASGFWLKYFTAYTNSVARRIDDRILE